MYGKARFGQHVLAAQLDAIDAGDACGLVDQPLPEIGHVGPARAAIGGAGRAVGEDQFVQPEQRRHLVEVVRHAARGRHGVDERAVLGAIGPHVDQPLHAQRDEVAISIEP